MTGFGVGKDGQPFKELGTLTLNNAIAFGDLNNDGIEDAAVLLADQFGGTGVSYPLIKYDQSEWNRRTGR